MASSSPAGVVSPPRGWLVTRSRTRIRWPGWPASARRPPSTSRRLAAPSGGGACRVRSMSRARSSADEVKVACDQGRGLDVPATATASPSLRRSRPARRSLTAWARARRTGSLAEGLRRKPTRIAIRGRWGAQVRVTGRSSRVACRGRGSRLGMAWPRSSRAKTAPETSPGRGGDVPVEEEAVDAGGRSPGGPRGSRGRAWAARGPRPGRPGRQPGGPGAAQHREQHRKQGQIQAQGTGSRRLGITILASRCGSRGRPGPAAGRHLALRL